MPKCSPSPHIPGVRSIRSLALGILAVFVALSLFSGCSSDPADTLREAAPRLREETIAQLVGNDEGALNAWGREIGHEGLAEIARHISRPGDEARTARAHDAAVAALGRVGDILEREYESRHVTIIARRMRRQGPRGDWEYATARDQFLTEVHRPEFRADHRSEIAREMMARAEAAGDSVDLTNALSDLAAALRDGRDEEASSRAAHRGLATALAIGFPHMAAQLLGELGGRHAGQGRADSAEYYWDRAYKVAQASRIRSQMARLLGFRAASWERGGRLALSCEIRDRIDRLFDSSEHPADALRHEVESAEFFERLGAWTAIQRRVSTGRILARSAEHTTRHLSVYEGRLDRLEARLLFEAGRFDEANVAAARADETLQNLPFHGHGSWATLWRSRILLGAGRFEEAIQVADSGEEAALAANAWAMAARFAVLRARHALAAGAPGRVSEHLQVFEERAARTREPLDAARMAATLARIDAARHLGDEAEIAAALDAAFREFERWLLGTDGSAPSYLILDGYRPLRDRALALAGDTRLAYELAQAWKGLGRRLGSAPLRSTETPAGPSAGGVRDMLEAWTHRLSGSGSSPSALRKRPGPCAPGSAHLLYVVDETRVTRWFAHGDSCRRDELPTSTAELYALVGEAIGRLSRDPGDASAPIDADLVEHLRHLGQVLLPPELLSPSGTTPRLRLYVTADSYLEELPFGVLNIGETGWHPLIADVDLATLRFTRTESLDAAPGAPLVVRPELSPAMTRRYPFLEALPAGVDEVEIVGAHWQNARNLEGADATKARLLALWEVAPVIWFTSHVVRDPEIPINVFLPLSPDSAGGAAAEYLETVDVLRADLSRCRLAVLSACSSGAPFHETDRTAPGLGAVFLDAGVETVVDTRWGVWDHEAAAFMERFLHHLALENGDAVCALAAARREAAARDGGARHPFFWGSWTVSTTRPGSAEGDAGLAPPSPIPVGER